MKFMPKENLEKDLEMQQRASEYEKEMAEKAAIARKYGVMNLDKIEKKNGQIYIDGLTPEQWEALHETSDTDYLKGQR
jgi:hypothetical protein